MNSNKKQKFNNYNKNVSKSDQKCNQCLNLDNDCEETIVLTDSRLTGLYDSDTSCPTDERPQHRINDFVVHDSDRRFCWFDSKPIDELFVCGFVEPIVSYSDIDSIGEQNKPKIRAQMIGPLQEWWFAGFDGGHQLVIGVESEFASYVLCEPNHRFRQLVTKCTENMFLTKLIIESLLQNPDSSYEDLIQCLEDKHKDFSEEKLLQFAPFITEQIQSFDSSADEDETQLCETKAIKTLESMSGLNGNNRKIASKSQLKQMSHIRPIARVDTRRLANSDTLTCSTPLVTEFFDSIFKDVIECQSNDSKHLNKTKVTFNDTSEMLLNEYNRKTQWVGNIVFEDRYARTQYYSTVKVGDQTFNSGDFAVFRERDNSLRFGKMMFMFSPSHKSKLCHIHYFCYGNETILAETAPDFMVFMTNHCNDIEVEKLVHKMDVCLTQSIDSNLKSEVNDKYFCNKLYFRKSGRIEDLPQEVFDPNIRQCIHCFIKDKKEKQNTPELDEEISEEYNESNGLIRYRKLIFKTQTYFVGDCALISNNSFDLHFNTYFHSQQLSQHNTDEEYDQRLYPERYRKRFTDYIKGLNNDLPKPLNIGLICEIYRKADEPKEETKLLLNVFFRPQNVYQSYEDFRNCDLNLVFWSNLQITVGYESLKSVCEVIYLRDSPKTDVYIDSKLFYFNKCYDFEMKSFLCPKDDIIERFSQNKRHKTIESKVKLNVLDLFSGCGGLSYGFHKLGLVSNLWAIEKDGLALQSYKTNYKFAQVFQEDVNHFLDLLLKGIKYHKNGQKIPEKGEIDLILGGPPCQGFSGMNRFSSRHYSLFKNSLVVSFLSFVDYYRPKYLMFENVRNFALFKCSMILKLMLSCLTRMGYQCQFAILQSGSYGLPQTRRRTVIIGSLTGHDLPHFPQPTHVFSRRQCQLSVTVDNRKYTAFGTEYCAQFPTITVDNAINDLPELTEDYAKDIVRQYREDINISHFQRLMRQNVDNNCLKDHFCKELSELCRIRIANIPIGSGNDWRDLPNINHTLTDGTVVEKLNYRFDDLKNQTSTTNEVKRGVCQCAQGLQCNVNISRQENTLIPWCLVHTANRQYHWSGLYGRLALNGYFPTTVTNPEPISKQGRVLHPNQNRIISVREAARSQGFPDNFALIGSAVDKYRQIGNAVPIPLSIALAKQFYDVFNV